MSSRASTGSSRRTARPPGGTSRRRAHRGRRSRGRPAGRVPWTWPIRSPGMNTPIECARAVTTRAGSRTSSWRRRNGAQAAISSGCGIAVVGRPALDDVGDEHVLAPPADRLEELGQEPARRARRTAGPGGSRRSPGPRRRTRPRCRGSPPPARPGARLVEAAAGADADLLRDRLERGAALGVGHTALPTAARGRRPVGPSRARRGSRRSRRRSSRRPCAGCR